MPEAVRISVSMRSFSTGARNGNTALSSSGVAARQPGLAWDQPEAETSIERKSNKDGFIKGGSFEMDEAALNGDCGCIGPVTDAQLA